jgi:tellurite resistance protein
METGTFTCPACSTAQQFARVIVGREMRLFAIRLPVGVYGEYIECAGCLSTFRPEVLAYDAGEETANVIGEYQRALRRVLALLVITDGQVHEAEIHTMQRIYEAVTGARLQRDAVLAEADEVAGRPVAVASYLARVIGYLNDRGKEQVLRGAAMVSGADGQIHPKEAEMVRRLGAVMALDPQRVDAVLKDFA